MAFHIDPKLEGDSTLIADLPLSQLRLSNNAAFPWVILVPRVDGITEIIDLDEAQQQALIKEIALVSRMMKTLYKADKLNVATLGNVVAQLHVHVIARFKADPAWPSPIWNSGHKLMHTQATLPVETQKIKAALEIE